MPMSPLPPSVVGKTRAVVDAQRRVPILRNEADYLRFAADRSLAAEDGDFTTFSSLCEEADLTVFPRTSPCWRSSPSRSAQPPPKRQRDILVPEVTLVGHIVIPTPFNAPMHYIRHPSYKDYTDPLVLSNRVEVHFDMLLEDEVFLGDVNASVRRAAGAESCGRECDAPPPLGLQQLAGGGGAEYAEPVTVDDVLSESDFCILIDLFEKATLRGEPIPFHVATQVAKKNLERTVHALVLRAVYNHWIGRRRTCGRPLLRMFHPPPSPSDSSPFAVFRPRQRERMTLRRPRRNPQENYARLAALVEDFKRVGRILEQLAARDQAKLKLARLDCCLFEQLRHEVDDPSYADPSWSRLRTRVFGTPFSPAWAPSAATYPLEYVSVDSRLTRAKPRLFAESAAVFAESPHLKPLIANRPTPTPLAATASPRPAPARWHEKGAMPACVVPTPGSPPLFGDLLLPLSRSAGTPSSRPTETARMASSRPRSREQRVPQPDTHLAGRQRYRLCRRYGRGGRVWLDRQRLPDESTPCDSTDSRSRGARMVTSPVDSGGIVTSPTPWRLASDDEAPSLLRAPLANRTNTVSSSIHQPRERLVHLAGVDVDAATGTSDVTAAGPSSLHCPQPPGSHCDEQVQPPWSRPVESTGQCRVRTSDFHLSFRTARKAEVGRDSPSAFQRASGAPPMAVDDDHEDEAAQSSLRHRAALVGGERYFAPPPRQVVVDLAGPAPLRTRRRRVAVDDADGVVDFDPLPPDPNTAFLPETIRSEVRFLRAFMLCLSASSPKVPAAGAPVGAASSAAAGNPFGGEHTPHQPSDGHSAAGTSAATGEAPPLPAFAPLDLRGELRWAKRPRLAGLLESARAVPLADEFDVAPSSGLPEEDEGEAAPSVRLPPTLRTSTSGAGEAKAEEEAYLSSDWTGRTAAADAAASEMSAFATETHALESATTNQPPVPPLGGQAASTPGDYVPVTLSFG